MADTKTTGLTENTAPVTTDLMYMVDDPGGSALSQKMTLATMRAFVKATGGRELIAENTPTGNSTSFASIPATYKHLVIEYVCRSDKAAVTSENMKIFLNNDTTATNYRRARMYGYGSNTVAADGGDDSNYDDPPCANSPAGSCSRGICNILYYAGTTFNKQIFGDASSRRDASSVHEFRIATGVEWENTAAVNRVDFTLASGNFVAGSTFRLYGVY